MEKLNQEELSAFFWSGEEDWKRKTARSIGAKGWADESRQLRECGDKQDLETSDLRVKQWWQVKCTMAEA